MRRWCTCFHNPRMPATADRNTCFNKALSLVRGGIFCSQTALHCIALAFLCGEMHRGRGRGASTQLLSTHTLTSPSAVRPILVLIPFPPCSHACWLVAASCSLHACIPCALLFHRPHAARAVGPLHVFTSSPPICPAHCTVRKCLYRAYACILTGCNCWRHRSDVQSAAAMRARARHVCGPHRGGGSSSPSVRMHATATMCLP